MPDDDDGGDDDDNDDDEQNGVSQGSQLMILSCLTYDLCALDLFMLHCQELQPDLKGRHKQQSPVGKFFTLFEYQEAVSLIPDKIGQMITQ